MAVDNNEEKNKIVLNRKMRLWNKYKKPVIGVISAVVVIAVVAVVLKLCSVGKPVEDKATTLANNNNNNNDIIITQSSIEMSNNETTSASETESTTSAVTESTTSSTTAAQVSGGVAKITTKAEIQEYTSRSNYDDAVFFGDMIVSGIGEYGYLDTSRIFSDNNLTTDKALNSVSSVAQANPSKVYVLVGLNDLNYGTRSGENVAERIGSIVESLKEAIPSVKVYVVSLLPITQTFESKSNVKITQAAIDEANSTLAARATEYGMTFIDIADAFKDESGYLNTDVSTGGYNLNHNYYPFFLNNIAGVSK